jgi:hypothetical protein
VLHCSSVTATVPTVHKYEGYTEKVVAEMEGGGGIMCECEAAGNRMQEKGGKV